MSLILKRKTSCTGVRFNSLVRCVLVFKLINLFLVITDRLRSMNLMNTFHDVDEMSSIKVQLKVAFNKLLRFSLAEVHKVNTKQRSK